MATRPVTFRGPTLEQILPPGAREAVLRKIALMAIGIIKRRTLAGVDVEGRPFAAYSTGYSEARRRAGRDTKPTLALSGAMLAAMQIIEASPTKVLIGFAGSAPQTVFTHRKRAVKGRSGAKVTHSVTESKGTVANASKAYWNDKGDGPPKRHFFGLSKSEQAELTKYAYREMIKLAGQASLKRALGR